MDGRDRALEGEETAVPPLFADDEFYRALSARPRRRLLAYLLEQEQSTVAELADVLCGWEVSGTMADPDRHRSARTVLRHMHLPRLDEAGLVRYDREAGEVALVELAGPVQKLVRRSIAAEQS